MARAPELCRCYRTVTSPLRMSACSIKACGDERFNDFSVSSRAPIPQGTAARTRPAYAGVEWAAVLRRDSHKPPSLPRAAIPAQAKDPRCSPRPGARPSDAGRHAGDRPAGDARDDEGPAPPIALSCRSRPRERTAMSAAPSGCAWVGAAGRCTSARPARDRGEEGADRAARMAAQLPYDPSPPKSAAAASRHDSPVGPVAAPRVRMGSGARRPAPAPPNPPRRGRSSVSTTQVPARDERASNR